MSQKHSGHVKKTKRKAEFDDESTKSNDAEKLPLRNRRAATKMAKIRPGRNAPESMSSEKRNGHFADHCPDHARSAEPPTTFDQQLWRPSELNEILQHFSEVPSLGEIQGSTSNHHPDSVLNLQEAVMYICSFLSQTPSASEPCPKKSQRPQSEASVRGKKASTSGAVNKSQLPNQDASPCHAIETNPTPEIHALESSSSSNSIVSPQGQTIPEVAKAQIEIQPLLSPPPTLHTPPTTTPPIIGLSNQVHTQTQTSTTFTSTEDVKPEVISSVSSRDADHLPTPEPTVSTKSTSSTQVMPTDLNEEQGEASSIALKQEDAMPVEDATTPMPPPPPGQLPPSNLPIQPPEFLPPYPYNTPNPQLTPNPGVSYSQFGLPMEPNFYINNPPPPINPQNTPLIICCQNSHRPLLNPMADQSPSQQGSSCFQCQQANSALHPNFSYSPYAPSNIDTAHPHYPIANSYFQPTDPSQNAYLNYNPNFQTNFDQKMYCSNDLDHNTNFQNFDRNQNRFERPRFRRPSYSGRYGNMTPRGPRSYHPRMNHQFQ